jgi:hypothetical protein
MPKGVRLGTVEDLKNRYPTAKLIHNWVELRNFPKESEDYTLEINEYNGFIRPKDNDFSKYYYLSTHTFNGLNFVNSTKALQKAGFNVIIDNWDKEEELK